MPEYPKVGMVVGGRQVNAVKCDPGTGIIRVYWAEHMTKWGACTLRSWMRWARAVERKSHA